MRAVGLVIGTLFGAVIAGILGMVALSLVAVAVMLFGGSTSSVQTVGTMTLAFIAGAAIVIVWVVAYQVRKANQTAKHQRDVAEQEAARKRQDRQDAIASVVSEAQTATNRFSWMPVRLQHAAESYARAEETFRDGAFSPFWSAIETAYAALADYLADAGRISQSAQRHANLVRQLAATGGVDAEIATFPVELDIARFRDQHRLVLTKLDALVYQAQKQPTFATIWEQRRTTAAVINGFRNLEDAVHSMGSRVSASIDDLGSQLQNNSGEVTRAISAQTSAASVASAQQLAELRQIREEASNVREHLYHPELTRWLR